MALAFPKFGTKKTVAAGVQGETIIDASTWRFDGNSGTVLVSSGFPLKPGQVTAATASQVRVYVSSVEQSVAIHPLDGQFPDGSYRSIGIQFSYNLTNDTPVSSQVKVNAGARGTLDLTWTEPTRTMVLKKSVIAPTDPSHLCDTFVTMQPLTPASNDSGTNSTWAASVTSGWAVSGIANGVNGPPALYNHVNGLYAMYCRTGTRSWFQWAYEWGTGFPGDGVIDNASQYALDLPYITEATGSTCTNESLYNPEPINGLGGSCGDMIESHSLRFISIAATYWMTAWRQPKRAIQLQVNRALSYTNSGYTNFRDNSISQSWGQRFNFGGQRLDAVLVGYLTGCTTELATFSLPAPTLIDYETHLPWILDALEDYVWNLPGDYRNGLVGQRHGTISEPGHTDANDMYGISNFQLSVASEFLMMYYDNVYPDSRIPPWIKTICDYMIGQSRLSVTGKTNPGPGVNVGTTLDDSPYDGSTARTGDVGYPTMYVSTYINTPTPIPDFEAQTVDASIPVLGGTTAHFYLTPYNLHMFFTTFAWYAAYSGDSTYSTWATRSSDTTNQAMTSAKNWGEYFGGTRLSALYYRNGGTVRGSAGIHPTVITNPPNQTSLG